MPELHARAIDGIPEIQPGDDLAAQIEAAGGPFGEDEVVVVSHKVVSKAEGCLVELASVQPGTRAVEIASRQDRDPRHVQVILDQSTGILRDERDVLICRTRHGFICANAGVDGSNSGDPDRLVLLPPDPDASARHLRRGLSNHPAVIISDSFGRPWRLGQAEVAIGLAGLAPLDDWRGRNDSEGRPLSATWIAIADQAAAAADLARRKDARQPVVVVRGLGEYVTAQDGPGAAALLRPAGEDLFG